MANIEYLIGLDSDSAENTKYHIQAAGRATWTENRDEARRFTDIHEAGQVMTDIANAPDVELAGMRHPATVIKSGLELGEAKKLKGRGILQLLRVSYTVVDHAPISGTIRPA